MADDGEMKDDVKMPEGDVGKKIQELWDHPEKDCSMYHRARFKPTNSLTLILDVIVLTSMGEQLAIDAKELQNKD